MAKAKGKFVLVMLESLAGSGARAVAKRLRLEDKLEKYMFDPRVRQWTIFREAKKLRTLKTK